MLADILHYVLHIFGMCKNMSILVSALTIATQMAISHVVRGLIVKKLQNETLKGLLLEFVASAELTGTAYELMIIANNYTKYGYAPFLFLMTIWWGMSWAPATACSYSLLEEYVETGGNTRTLIMKILAQICGGLVSFRWVRPLWQLHFAATHVGAAKVLINRCTADLSVPLLIGFSIELILTCACRLVSRGLGELEPKFASAIDSFFGTAMVLWAFETSGGYFNPILAMVKLGCKGHTNIEHVFVYWAGSILGAMLSIKLWNTPVVHDNMLAPFKPVEEKEKDE
ncbi:unnamed protein product [Meganyctiphanes norvegica]|uniref:Aquaporin n=1 Tax=Meganyctiphanes norvegica TaxID=48144 RepID=A0AAV2R8M0_MEGNR